MGIFWSRLFRTIYRREPVIGIVATVGVVDAAMGGFSGHWSLLAVGTGTVGLAIALYWRQSQRRRPLEVTNQRPVYVLPPSSRTGLPTLSIPKKNAPGNR